MVKITLLMDIGIFLGVIIMTMGIYLLLTDPDATPNEYNDKKIYQNIIGGIFVGCGIILIVALSAQRIYLNSRRPNLPEEIEMMTIQGNYQ
jgi:uncharacterized membrane protein (DUF441 family)